MNNELCHYGVMGMKWGVRKKTSNAPNDKPRRHLGIDSRGNITFTRDKTTKKNVQKFAVKTAIFSANMGLSLYISKHPEVIYKGMQAVNKMMGNGAI